MIEFQTIFSQAEKKLKKYNTQEKKVELIQQLYDVVYSDIKEDGGFDARMVVDFYKKITQVVDTYLSANTQDNWHLAIFNDFFLTVFQQLSITNEFYRYMEQAQLYHFYKSQFATKLEVLYHEGYIYHLDHLFQNTNIKPNDEFSIQFEGTLKKQGELIDLSLLNQFIKSFSYVQKKNLKIEAHHEYSWQWKNANLCLISLNQLDNMQEFFQHVPYKKLKKSLNLNEFSSIEALKAFSYLFNKNSYTQDEKKQYQKDLSQFYKENKAFLKELDKFPEIKLSDLFSHLSINDYKEVIESVKPLFKGKLVKSLLFEAIDDEAKDFLTQLIKCFEKEVLLYISQKDRYYDYLAKALNYDNEIFFNLLIKSDYKFDCLKLKEHTQTLLFKELKIDDEQKKIINLYFHEPISQQTKNDVLFLVILLDKPKMLNGIEEQFNDYHDNLATILPFFKEHIGEQRLQNNLSYNKVLLEQALSYNVNNTSENLTKKKKKI